MLLLLRATEPRVELAEEIVERVRRHLQKREPGRDPHDADERARRADLREVEREVFGLHKRAPLDGRDLRRELFALPVTCAAPALTQFGCSDSPSLSLEGDAPTLCACAYEGLP